MRERAREFSFDIRKLRFRRAFSARRGSAGASFWVPAVFLPVLFFFSFGRLPQHLEAAEAFIIEDYDIYIEVGADNAYQITETLDLDFSEPRHGIIRTLPLYTPEGKRVDIRDISAGCPLKAYDTKKYKELRLGSRSEEVEGKVSYEISYCYDIGDDNNPYGDEFYFNLVGTDWMTDIKHVTFTVVMPAPFPEDELYFTWGAYGSAEAAPVRMTAEGTVIRGELEEPLAPMEGLTLRIPLEEGYYTGDLRGGLSRRQKTEYILYAAFLLTGSVVLLITFLKKRRPASVEFRAPEGVTPADMDFVYNGSLGDKSFAALLMHWACRGIITLRPRSRKNPALPPEDILLYFSESDPEGLRPFEKHYLDFLKSKSFNKKYTSLKILGSEVNAAQAKFRREQQAYWQEESRRIFREGTEKWRYLLLALGLLPLLIYWGSLYSRADVGWISALLFVLIHSGLMYFVGLRPWAKWVRDPSQHKAKSKKSLLYALFFLAAGYFFAVLVTRELRGRVDSLGLLLAYVAAALWQTAQMSFYFYTDYGRELLGKLDGYAAYLRATEREIATPAGFMESPAFFRGLPYACLLGISERWAARFRPLKEVEAPKGLSAFQGYNSPVLFSRTLDRSMDAISRGMGTSGGGGGGGSSGSSGGSSGGGSGGGGGRSW